MSGKSSKSQLITLRLPNDVVYTLTHRINGKRGRWQSIGDYLKERIIYDVRRSHSKKKGQNK